MNGRQNATDQVAANRDLSKLECDCTGVTHDPRTDLLIGNGGADYLYGGGSNDTINGGSGWDVAMYDLARDQYTVTATVDGYSVEYIGPGGEATDVLIAIEALQFSDQLVYL